jgi:hypothetical protein
MNTKSMSMRHALVRSLCAALGTASVFVLLGAGLAVLPAQTAEAGPYWRCPAGWTFRVNSAGTGAQCFRRTSNEVQPINCPNVTVFGQPVGTFAQARAGQDKCIGETRVAGVVNRTEHDPLPCPAGYRYRQDHVSTGDRCVKSGELQHRSPSAQFESTP